MSDADDDGGFVVICDGHDFVATAESGVRGMFYGEGAEPARADWSSVIPPEDGPGAVIVTEEPAPHEHNPPAVWLVVDEIPYEGAFPVAIFKSEGLAEKFAERDEDFCVIECAVNRSALFVDGVFGFYGLNDLV